MREFLDQFAALTIGTGLALLLFGLAWIFRAKLPREWKIGEISLAPHRWLLLFFVLAGTLGIVVLANQYIEQKTAEHLVPASDPSKYSILVPDFVGDGGSDAARIVADQLQRLLGSGAQILRVPCKLPSAEYGDVARDIQTFRAASAACLVKYNGDLVVAGNYYRNSDVAELTYASRSDPCIVPPDGIYFLPTPPSPFSIEAITQNSSPIQSSLFSATVYKILSPILIVENRRRLEVCFKNVKMVLLLEQKTANLLDGLPNGANSTGTYAILVAQGIFHIYHSRATGEPGVNDLAIEMFRQARALVPTHANDASDLYGLALIEKMPRIFTAQERRQVARLIDSLQATGAGSAALYSLARSKADAFEYVFQLSRDDHDLALSLTRYERARELSRAALPANDEESLLLEVTMGGLYLIQASHGLQSGLSNATSHINRALQLYWGWTKDRRRQADRNLRYQLIAAALRLSHYSTDPQDVASTTLILSDDPGIIYKEDWKNIYYAQLASELSHSYFRTFELIRKPLLAHLAEADLLRVAENASNADFSASARYELAEMFDKEAIILSLAGPRQAAIQQYILASKVLLRVGNKYLAARATQRAAKLAELKPLQH